MCIRDSLENDEENPFLTLVRLYNLGLLEKIRPRYVLLESTAYWAADRAGEKLDWQAYADLHTLQSLYSDSESLQKKDEDEAGATYFKKRRLISTANLKFLRNTFLYMFSDTAVYSRIRILKLNKPLFSTTPKTFAVRETNRKLPALVTKEAVRTLHQSLNRLTERLEVKGKA